MIVALRFIERAGKRILQAADDETCRVEDGQVVYDWKDVPFEEKP